MNFQELMARMNELDQPVKEEKFEEKPIDECGMGPMSSPSGQQDNVSMSINMNGSGSGGIRDILDILRNIEHGGDAEAGMPGADELGALIGKMDHPMDGGDDKAVVLGAEPIDEFANEPNEVYAPVDAAYPTGDDLASHGGNEVEKAHGGGNPYTNVSEDLVNRLQSMYEEVKSKSGR